MHTRHIRLACGILVAAAFATAAVRAQITRTSNLYEDPELTRMLVDVTTAMGAIAVVDPTISLIAAPAIAANITWHEMLTIARIDAEMNTMAAIMTEGMRDQDQQIRGAVAASTALVAKIKRDIAYWDEKHPGFKSGQRPSAISERDEFEVYQEVQKRLKAIDKGGEIDVVTAGDDLVATFDKMRGLILGKGLFSRVQFLQNGTGLTAQLKKFGDASLKAGTLVTTKVKLSSGADADPSPMQNLRVMIENASQDDAQMPGGLVFFARTWELAESGGTVQDCQGASYKLPEVLGADGRPVVINGAPLVNEAWTTVYPQTAAPEFGAVGAGANKEAVGDVRLPTKVFLPISVRGRLELRVATYGALRKRIRWQDVVGRVVRPEVNSMPRGFYWFAYEAVQSDMAGGTLKSRWFPIEETYTWLLSGGWSSANAGPLAARLESTSGSARRELRTGALDQNGQSLLKMSNDRAVYCFPRSVDLMLSDPFLSAEVRGEATIRHITQALNDKGQSETETGSGQIAIRIQRW